MYFLDQINIFLIWSFCICAAQCTAPTAASRQIGCIKWGPWLGFGKWTCAPSFGDHPAPTAAAANLSKYEANFCQILWTHVIAGTKFVNRRSTESKFQFNFVDICPLTRESSWQYWQSLEYLQQGGPAHNIRMVSEMRKGVIVVILIALIFRHCTKYRKFLVKEPLLRYILFSVLFQTKSSLVWKSYTQKLRTIFQTNSSLVWKEKKLILQDTDSKPNSDWFGKF